MNSDTDKRQITSPENGRKSSGPKTDVGKARAAMNAFKHGAYSKKILFPGEDESELHELLVAHLHLFAPQNKIEETLVLKMTYTLWRSLRQAPAQASLVAIQMLRMAPAIKAEFAEVTPEDLHALAGASLGHHGPHHLTREEVRLTRLYENLRHQLEEIRSINPPDPPDHQPQPEQTTAPTTAPAENAETNLNHGPQPAPTFNPNADIFSFLTTKAGRPFPKEVPVSPPESVFAAR